MPAASLTAHDTTRLRADTLVSSVVILLAASVIQRTVGFGRGILFCRWLEPGELGQWEMAYSFLLLAAPLAVLGVPGSFGRYVEFYRQQGRLGTFLRRTTVWTAILSLTSVGLILLAAPYFSDVIFGRSTQTTLVALVAVSLAAVILHHFLEALFTGLRMFRIVSMMHFAQSLGFAAISLSLLCWWKLGASSIVIGYGAACLISAAGAISWLLPALRELPEERGAVAVPHRTFWPKLLRFAFWVWMTNLLAGLFAVVDRYMLVHWGKLSADEALVQVGHYHSSRVVPLLLLSVAELLSGILLPYLSQDWEAGRRQAVHQRLNFVLKATSLLAFAGGVCVLLAAPLLFGVALKGKYEGGLAVLPLTLTYCAFNGLAVVALTYLWCAERTFLSAVPMAVALIANVCLNMMLVPRYGLAGAVVGTTIANAACLVTVYWLSRLIGMQFDFGTLALSALPAALIGGPEMAVPVLAVTIAAICNCPSLFSQREREELSEWRNAWIRRYDGFRDSRRNSSIP